ncbi:hypothetical protein T10_1278 [Trichinella papuae]|uniref:Uncharacterized protein n=1 Tax=Trichinella papuae TaxID=268474 RepID=A0A0V1MQK2_9BILA|nr:hypothetical protein T10_1278 [Trichinella papuae]
MAIFHKKSATPILKKTNALYLLAYCDYLAGTCIFFKKKDIFSRIDCLEMFRDFEKKIYSAKITTVVI